MNKDFIIERYCQHAIHDNVSISISYAKKIFRQRLKKRHLTHHRVMVPTPICGEST